MAHLRARQRVVAVVVAYDREVLLRECLAAIGDQSTPVSALVVVDNASADRSAEIAREFARPDDVLMLTSNTGGAGGFTVGIAHAVTHHDPDWLWLLDDDTVPTPTALEEMLAVAELSRDTDLRVLASRVLWTDGREHPMNTPRARPFPRSASAAAAAGAVPVRSASFVSSLLSSAAVAHKGYPIADYFLWNDDFEYTARLIRGANGWYCPKSVVVHKTRSLASSQDDPGERFFWEVRNKLWLFRRSQALAGWEKAVYFPLAIARWTRAIVRSRKRSVLSAALRRGLRAGLFSAPRPNSEVLVDSGVPSNLLDAIAKAPQR